MTKREPPLAKAERCFLRQSPHKVRMVADLVRGRAVSDAIAILRFSKRRAAADVLQLLNSAVAGLHATESAVVHDEENLYVSRLWVDGGPTMRRFKAMSMGRAGMRRKRTSSIRIELAERSGKRRRRVVSKKVAAANQGEKE